MKHVTTAICLTALLFFYPGCQDPDKKDDAQPAEVVCFVDITTTVEGQYKYETIASDASCPAPGPAAKAKADREAHKNLETYGVAWCEENKCEPGKSCKPELSDIKNQGYRTESRPSSTQGKNDCYVIATISGKVSCKCK